ncbi:MAG TPA: hypothetical protein VGL55_11140 [Steroidobacteraceae bacterium]|jgi:hypothetical protein
MVGNANNGNASTFGPNGTHPDGTETTGLEVVKPIDARSVNVLIPSGNSAEVDPLLQFPLGKNSALDKAGKDDNYRGVTQFGGALYFTKGSGSNGMDTVYTVSSLPPLTTDRCNSHQRGAGFSHGLRSLDRGRIHAVCRLLRQCEHPVRER